MRKVVVLRSAILSLGFIICGSVSAALPGLENFQRLAMGQWNSDGKVIRQSDDQGPAFLLYGARDQSRYSVTTKVRLSKGKSGGEAGLLLHFSDPDNYVAYAVTRRRSGPYAVLRIARKKPQLSFVADQARAAPAADGWYELRADVNGRDVYCYLNNEPLLAYSFEGTPPPYNSHGKTWETDPVSGWTGLIASDSTADYSGFRASSFPQNESMIAPQRGRFDDQGRLMPRQSYAETMRRYTDWFLHSPEIVDNSKAPQSVQNLPPYLITNFAGTDDTLWNVGGEMAFNHALIIEGAVYYYLYSGDKQYLDVAIKTADWQIEHRTPRDWAMPFLAPSFVSFQKDGSWKGMEWGYEPDKSAYVGFTLLKLYAATGTKKYLDAALETAGTLARYQGPNGDWPFRVNAKTGEVKHGYTCSQLWYVWFFEKLADITGDQSFRSRRDKAFAWLLANPVKTNQWMGLYGDIASGARSFDQWVAIETAIYLIDHRNENPTYLEDARRITEWIERTLVVDYGFFPGVPGIVEQSSYRIVLTHHQLRFGEIYAKLWEATGDEKYKRRSIEAANSVTWNLMADGKMRQGFWDHAKAVPLILCFNNQFGRIMSAIPESAAKGENHLLQSSGLVGPVSYSRTALEYKTIGPGYEVLTIASAPKKVVAGGQALKQSGDPRVAADSWQYEVGTGRLRLNHRATDVRIELN
jgi:rhamnogalacturonyl hydrolase YesR